ncbi:MAG TPA: hypothetical protein VK578_03225 [Edaphobacter sp.]|nr:hypothetical protein [Edaphobacter sp.]
MSEPTETIDLSAEVETLRRVNGELVTKSATRKARVTELEAVVTELQSKLSEAHDSLHQLTVMGPLNAIAKEISIAPELWLEKFSQSYRLEMVKGQLTLQTADGKPVLKGEKPVPFERQSLIDMLTSDAHPQCKAFKSITIASKASGANASGGHRSVQTSAEPKQLPQFGLR